MACASKLVCTDLKIEVLCYYIETRINHARANESSDLSLAALIE